MVTEISSVHGWVLAAVLLPPLSYLVFRCAACGWFGVKHHYNRRLIDGHRKENR